MSEHQTITLRQVWADYQLSKKLKPATIRNYNQRLNCHIEDWLDIDVRKITKNMVEERHRSIPGDAMANSTFRTLRALLHFAAVKYEYDDGEPFIKVNPCKRLNDLGQWRTDRRRKTYIPSHLLKMWWDAVESLENKDMRDFLQILVMTGFRKHELLELQWKQVDLLGGLVILGKSGVTKSTKNGEENVVIPVCDAVRQILIYRKENQLNEYNYYNGYVFPSKTTGTHCAAGWTMYREVVHKTGIEFSFHDLRRTFASMAAEADVPHQMIKRLLNHVSNDITDHYIQLSVDKLKAAANRTQRKMMTYVEPTGLPKQVS